MNKQFKISNKVSLPINEGKVDFVPEEGLEFVDHKNLMEQVGICVSKSMPLLLIGETGTGKTSLIRYLAKETHNGFRRVNHSGGTTIDDIKGKILINKEGTFWIDGVLVEAMKNGWWYLADEINACSPEILFVYNSLLDDDGFVVLEENNGEIIKPHPNFRFFASMNPSSDYAGTKELNKALLSRFIVIKADFSPPIIEQGIIVNRIGVSKEVAKKMVQFATEVRIMKTRDKTDFVLSTRELLLWATMYKEYNKYLPSGEITLLNKVPDEDFTVINDLMSMHFKFLDNPVKEADKGIKMGIEEAMKKLRVGDRIKTNGDGTTTSAYFEGTVAKKDIKHIYITRDDGKAGKDTPNQWAIAKINEKADIQLI